METLIKISQFILSFSLLIIIHELGHYMFARMFGIRVEKFYLFFNPGFSLFKKKIGDTEYGIGWIPFGGYVKIAGMIDESMDTEQMKQPAKEYEFRSKPAWQRLLVMLGGVIMNVVLAIVIYIGFSWHYGEEYIRTEDVKFGWVFNDLGHELGFRDGDIVVNINGSIVEDYRMVFQEIAVKRSCSVNVLRDGEVVAIDIPKSATEKLLESPDFMFPRVPFVVQGIVEGSGAHRAGVVHGDSLVAVDGTDMAYFDQYLQYVKEKKGETIELQLIRNEDGEKTPVTLEVELSEEGKMGLEPYGLGRYVPIQSKSYNFFTAIPAGFKRTGEQLSSYWSQMKLLADPETKAYKSIGSFIAISQIFPKLWDWSIFWQLTAFLSLVLAVMNILPIPGLDGGHVMFVLYELITGRKPGEKFMEYSMLIGLLLLFSLIIFATGNDIYRFFIK